MSSGYRGGGYRGRGGYDRGYGGYHRGRGGYKPRRYWDRDSDDYHRRDRDRDRRDRRRSRSRSRSRSDSRSRSRSESRSRSRSRSPEPRRDKAGTPPRTTEEYQPTPVVPPSQFPVQLKDQFDDPYDPAMVSRKKEKWSNDPPAFANQQLSKSQNGQIAAVPPPTISAQYAVQQYQQMQYQMANYQKQQQLQQAQAEAYNAFSSAKDTAGTTNISASTETGFGTYGDRGQGFQTHKQQLPDDLYQPQILSGYGAAHEEPIATKKKKESRKKKRRRKSSSSSSSSSSSESSDSRTKQKRKSKLRRESDNSSESSSEEEKREKVKVGGLTNQQREALVKQGDSYKKKLEILEREIKRLRTKEDELAIAKADIKLIEENLKLQAELKGRCKAVNIVLEKINTVLRGEICLDSKPKPVAPPPPKISQSSSSPCPTQQVTLVTSPPLVKKDEKHRNFDYFDNGLHWCRLCNVFPESVGAILEHFHSIDHQTQVEQLGIDEKPWHKRNSLKEAKPEAGALKVPFKGIQFFTPVQGWYCRICSAWIGDPHCATEHLKSEDHNNNFANFLDEHPDWEAKWLADREKARVRSGLSASVAVDQRQQQEKSGIYSFQTDESKGVGVRYQPGAHDFNDDENSKSIRVQMRNMVKENEARPVVMPVITPSKDTTVEEWMGKTQSQNVPIDIDTQKFAEIVRQKHGVAKEKEKESAKKAEPNRPPAPNYFRGRDSGRDRDYDYEPNRRFSDKRYEPRADLSFHVRERDDRDRGRGGRFGRRRSRSKSRDRSRSRERDSRDTRRRRDRSRSKSRERDRDRKRSSDAKERDPVRRLPMIGKMPLYKKPTATGKDAENSGSGEKAPDSAALNNEYGPTPPAGVTQTGEQPATVNTAGLPAESVAADNALTGYGYGMSYDTYGSAENNQSQSQTAKYPNVAAKRSTDDMKPPGESAAPTTGTSGGQLPDDLQHALDIIYSGAAGGKPATIPFPPPGMGITAEQMGMPPPAAPAAYDYATSYNYMGYEPYQHSFEGYVPASEYGGEISDMSSGVPQGSGNSSTNMPTETEDEMYTVASDTSFSNYEPKPEPEPPAEDDIEDLRMLGIDVDDVAAVNMK